MGFIGFIGFIGLIGLIGLLGKCRVELGGQELIVFSAVRSNMHGPTSAFGASAGALWVFGGFFVAGS